MINIIKKAYNFLGFISGTSHMAEVRILIVDDHRMFREGLKALLERDPTKKVIGEADNGRTALTLIDELQPDLVVMDVGMPQLNGIDATRLIRSKSRQVKVIALSVHSDRRFIAGMLQAGASGYLLKDCAFEELSSALDTVISGKTYVSPQIAGTIVDDYVEHLGATKKMEKLALSQQERCVLQLLTEGKSTKEIARNLHVSVKTIETHRKHIMDKLNLYSVADLTKYAIREGVTSL